MRCLLALLFLVSCGPTLTVRHEDFTAGTAFLQLDGGAVRQLAYRDKAKWSLTPGVHALQATDEKGNSPWLGATKEWQFWVDGDVAVTLQAPDAAMPLPAAAILPTNEPKAK